MRSLAGIVFLAMLLASPSSANRINTASYQFNGSTAAANSGVVSETITTVPGEQYQISFQGNLSALYAPTSLNFLFGDLLNQSLLGDLGQQYSLWRFGQCSSPLATFNFLTTADSSATTLAFQYALTSEDYGLSIRNLTVNRVPDGAATAALLSFAGTGLFFLRHRLKRKC